MIRILTPTNISRFFVPLILMFITFLTYFNILPNQLFYDDEELIYQNAYVKNIKFFPKYFSENMIAGAGKLSNMYRPILLTSFAFDYLIWGNNQAGYHLTSIFLHAANSILIFFLLNILFENRLLAFLTSIFFIIHPVQTETIAYASGRTDPLFSFFTLSSLILSLSLLKDKKLAIVKYIGIICLFILAILTKETAIIVPLLTLLVILIKFGRQKNIKTKLAPILIPLFLIDIIYILLRLTVLNFANTLNFYQSANVYSQNLLVRFYTFSRVFFEYVKVIFFPAELIFARNIEFIISPFNLWVVLFLLTFTFIMIYLIKNKGKNRIVLFAMWWFFINILPVSGIIPINSIMTEHYLYLPSISFFLLLAYFFHLVWRKYSSSQHRSLFVFFTICVIVSLFIRTILRNLDWKDPITFYTKSLAQSPWHVPMRHNLAMTYAKAGKFDTAIKEYRILISYADVYPQTHHNLANAYKTIGKFKEAEEEYLKALEMDPKFFFSLYGLADLYKITGEKEKLEETVNKIQDLKLQIPDGIR